MMRCLQLAALAGRKAMPNPLVGAVLVYRDRIIGEGYHQQYGGPHAEVNCFDSVTDQDRSLIPESTLYVSLEPCAHYGKTPPCALRIIQEGVRKVVVANRDPFEAVNGKGIELLQAAGISVELGILDREAAWLNRRFFTLHTLHRPYIILKWAQTVSGYFAPLDGSRLQISNSFTRSLNREWRAKESAIMVGTRTALADNPRLLDALGEGPLRIVLDRSLQIPEHYQLLDRSAPTWLVNEIRGDSDGDLCYIRESFDAALLTRICTRLATESYSSLIVEGGALLLQSFLDAGLWDEIRIFETPDVLQEGIMAPVLPDIKALARFSVADNELLYYVHPANMYVPSTFALSSLPL